MLDELRDKDAVVFESIHDGLYDTHQIAQHTTLASSEVRYCLYKLDELGLIQLSKPDGMVTRVVDGQKRVFNAPLQACLTETGERALEHCQNDEVDQYQHLSHGELIRYVHELEARITDLEHSFEVFRRQMQRRLE